MLNTQKNSFNFQEFTDLCHINLKIETIFVKKIPFRNHYMLFLRSDCLTRITH